MGRGFGVLGFWLDVVDFDWCGLDVYSGLLLEGQNTSKCHKTRRNLDFSSFF